MGKRLREAESPQIPLLWWQVQGVAQLVGLSLHQRQPGPSWASADLRHKDWGCKRNAKVAAGHAKPGAKRAQKGLWGRLLRCWVGGMLEQVTKVKRPDELSETRTES